MIMPSAADLEIAELELDLIQSFGSSTDMSMDAMPETSRFESLSTGLDIRFENNRDGASCPNETAPNSMYASAQSESEVRESESTLLHDPLHGQHTKGPEMLSLPKEFAVAVSIHFLECNLESVCKDRETMRDFERNLQLDIVTALGVPESSVALLCYQGERIEVDIALFSHGEDLFRAPEALADELVAQVQNAESVFRRLPLGKLAYHAVIHGYVAKSLCHTVILARRTMQDALGEIKASTVSILELKDCRGELKAARAEIQRLQSTLETISNGGTVVEPKALFAVELSPASVLPNSSSSMQELKGFHGDQQTPHMRHCVSDSSEIRTDCMPGPQSAVTIANTDEWAMDAPAENQIAENDLSMDRFERREELKEFESAISNMRDYSRLPDSQLMSQTFESCVAIERSNQILDFSNNIEKTGLQDVLHSNVMQCDSSDHCMAVGLHFDFDFDMCFNDSRSLLIFNLELQRDLSFALNVPKAAVHILCHQRGNIISEIALSRVDGPDCDPHAIRSAQSVAEDLNRQVQDINSVLRHLPLGMHIHYAEIHGVVDESVCYSVLLSQWPVYELLDHIGQHRIFHKSMFRSIEKENSMKNLLCPEDSDVDVELDKVAPLPQIKRKLVGEGGESGEKHWDERMIESSPPNDHEHEMLYLHSNMTRVLDDIVLKLEQSQNLIVLSNATRGKPEFSESHAELDVAPGHFEKRFTQDEECSAIYDYTAREVCRKWITLLSKYKVRIAENQIENMLCKLDWIQHEKIRAAYARRLQEDEPDSGNCACRSELNLFNQHLSPWQDEDSMDGFGIVVGLNFEPCSCSAMEFADGLRNDLCFALNIPLSSVSVISMTYEELTCEIILFKSFEVPGDDATMHAVRPFLLTLDLIRQVHSADSQIKLQPHSKHIIKIELHGILSVESCKSLISLQKISTLNHAWDEVIRIRARPTGLLEGSPTAHPKLEESAYLNALLTHSSELQTLIDEDRGCKSQLTWIEAHRYYYEIKSRNRDHDRAVKLNDEILCVEQELSSLMCNIERCQHEMQSSINALAVIADSIAEKVLKILNKVSCTILKFTGQTAGSVGYTECSGHQLKNMMVPRSEIFGIHELIVGCMSIVEDLGIELLAHDMVSDEKFRSAEDKLMLQATELQDLKKRLSNYQDQLPDDNEVAVSLHFDLQIDSAMKSQFHIVEFYQEVQQELATALKVQVSSLDVLGHFNHTENGILALVIAIRGHSQNAAVNPHLSTASSIAQELVEQAADATSSFRSLKTGRLSRSAELHGSISAALLRAILMSQRANAEALDRLQKSADTPGKGELKRAQAEISRLQKQISCMVLRSELQAALDDVWISTQELDESGGGGSARESDSPYGASSPGGGDYTAGPAAIGMDPSSGVRWNVATGAVQLSSKEIEVFQNIRTSWSQITSRR